MSKLFQSARVIALCAGLAALTACGRAVSPLTPTTQPAAPAAQAQGGGVPTDYKTLDLTAETAAGRHTLAFQSSGYGGASIYVLDLDSNTIFALPGVNVGRVNCDPHLSRNGRYLVYETSAGGRCQIFRYDLLNQTIDTLGGLNGFGNEREPDISDDGCSVVYVSDDDGDDEIRLYNFNTRTSTIFPAISLALSHPSWPTISGDGKSIAFGAQPRSGYGRVSIYVYRIPTASLITPPYVDADGANNYNPTLSEDGSRMLFASDCLGNERIFEANLNTGDIDDLTFANAACRNQRPVYVCNDNYDRIAFQSDRGGAFQIYFFERLSGLLRFVGPSGGLLESEDPDLDEGDCLEAARGTLIIPHPVVYDPDPRPYYYYPRPVYRPTPYYPDPKPTPYYPPYPVYTPAPYDPDPQPTPYYPGYGHTGPTNGQGANNNNQSQSTGAQLPLPSKPNPVGGFSGLFGY